MMSLNLHDLTISQAHKGLVSREFSARDLAQAYLDRIAEKNDDLNVYLEVFDDVIEQATVVDNKIESGEPILPLTGIPLAIKDNILIEGRHASSASRILDNYIATYDATVIKKLKDEGAVFLGRANMDEFAMGGSTENSAYGPTKNPLDVSRVPGGSSGGSAAAVAGDLALAALGSDTGGSIRQPASFCGVVGLKPTYGTVSRYGLMAMASSLDQIGPLTKTVEDTELLYRAIAGRDPLDSTSIEAIQDNDKKAKKIGVPRSFLEGLNEETTQAFNQALDKLRGRGYEIIDIELPSLKYALACYYIIMPAEASTNLARFDGMRYGLHASGENLLEDYKLTRGEGFGREVRRRIMLGTYVLSAGYYDAYYHKAVRVEQLIREEYRKAFEAVDLIATPTAPGPAFRIGEKTNDPLQMYLEDIFTVPVNIAGIPAISVPMGKTSEGLPLGLQLAAPHFAEDALFAVGKDFSR